MNKKLLALTFSLALLLVGCSNSTGSSDTITFWAYEPTSTSRKDELNSLIQDFEQQHDVKVETTYIPKEEFATKLNSSIAVSKNPDVAYLDQTLIAMNAEDNTLLDLTEFIENSSDLSLDDYFQGALETNYYEGKIYGLPLSMSTVAMYYNKDLVPTPPTTWEEWVNIAKEVYVPNEVAAFSGIGDGGWAAWLLPAFIHNAGGSMMNADNTEVKFADQPGIDAMNLIKELISYSDQSIRSSQNAFGNGLVAFDITGVWEIDVYRASFPDLNFGVALIPSKDGVDSYSNIGGDNIVIFDNTKNPDLSFEFIKHLTTAESSLVMADVTGNFPAHVEAAQNPKYTGDEHLNVFMKQLEHAVARPTLTKWYKVNDEVLGKAIDSILISGSDVEATMKDAANKATQILFE